MLDGVDTVGSFGAGNQELTVYLQTKVDLLEFRNNMVAIWAS